jgi:hypothetical protein
MPSDAHSINSINAKTRFGGGNRHTSKTVAKGHVDLAADYIEITSGKAAYDKKTQTFTTSTGRVYGYHADKVAESGSSSIYPMRGNPGDFVNLTQAEFDILQRIRERFNPNWVATVVQVMPPYSVALRTRVAAACRAPGAKKAAVARRFLGASA